MALYRLLKRNRAILNSIFIAVFTSLFFNALSDNTTNVFEQPEAFLVEVVNLNTVAGMLTIFSLIFLVLLNVLLYVWEKIINHYDINDQFNQIMISHTSPRIRESVTPGIFSWGDDKTVEICDQILFGWKPEVIRVLGYVDEEYAFAPDDKAAREIYGDNRKYYFNQQDYDTFRNSDSFRKIIEEGNNLPRFMLKGCKTNFSKSQKEIQLYMGRTEWSACRYVWSKMGSDAEVLAGYAEGITTGQNSEIHLPNSLCMHVIIETKDDYVILSKISKTKFNDKPGTWAATLGEQIEVEDYVSGNNFHKDFVMRTVKRAFDEEYKIAEDKINDIIDESATRILAIDFEGDIYNFAMACCVKLSCTAKQFIEMQKSRLVTAEATELKAITYKEILDILKGYPENKAEYHPSTYLRLMLMYMHRYGIDKLQRDIVR